MGEKRRLRDFIFGKEEEKQEEIKTKEISHMVGINNYSIKTTAENELFFQNDIIQSCISAHSNLIKKSTFKLNNIQDKNLEKKLRKPNLFFTMPEFLEKIVIHLLINNNVFINVRRKSNYEIDSLHIIDYNTAEVFESNNEDLSEEDRIFIKFLKKDGIYETISYNDIIHIKKTGYSTDIFTKSGISQVLFNTLDMQNHLDKDIVESIKGKGMKDIILKHTININEDDREKAMQDFLKYGIYKKDGLTIYSTYEGEDLELRDRTDREASLKTYKVNENPAVNRIYNYFNVDPDIVSGKMTKERMHYFIQTNIEPLLILIQEAFTHTLLTENQIEKNGKISLVLVNNKLDTLEISEKINAIEKLAALGVLTRNTILESLGLPRIKGEEGEVCVGSLNYMDASKITEYKLQKDNKNKKEEAEENEGK